MENFKIKYKFFHCKNPKAIIEKLYPNEFKNTNYANNRMKYLSFLNRVEKDKRWNELAMELGFTNCQTSNEQKAKEIAQSVSFFWTNEEDGEKSLIDTNSLRKAVFNAAQQAMEWKDEQHAQEKQQWIDKVCEYLSTVDLSAYLDGNYVVISFKRSEFIDDFKQAMKGKNQ